MLKNCETDLGWKFLTALIICCIMTLKQDVVMNGRQDSVIKVRYRHSDIVIELRNRSRNMSIEKS